jgi:hypothetical protein
MDDSVSCGIILTVDSISFSLLSVRMASPESLDIASSARLSADLRVLWFSCGGPFGVIDELVDEDNDRRLCEASSCSVNEDALVDRSSEMFVIKVGDVVEEDCVSFDSSSILTTLTSCSWLGIEDS